MFKKIILILVVSLFSIHLFSQESYSFQNSNIYAFKELDKTTINNSNFQNNTTSFNQYWSFGGTLGLSFWNGGTDILLAPKAYYNFSEIFLTGFGITYIYSDYNSGLYKYTSNSFGGSVMAGLRPIPFLQLSIEYEGLQTNRSGFYNENYWNNALYLGFAFVAGNVSFGVRYDVLFDDNRSAYSSAFSPVIGFYF